ncbi:MAG: glycosyltransferase family 4 protein [bacterium]
MKIAILSTIEPFIHGGAKKQFTSLKNTLQTMNHQVDLFLIPFSFEINDLKPQIQAIRKIKINSDILITSRPMSYCIEHNNKIVWFMHHISYFYEFYQTKLNPYPNNSDFANTREEFIKQDTAFLLESKKIYAVSEYVADKLKLYNNIQSSIVYPFLDDYQKFHFQNYSDYFYLPSLITYTKRQHLIIEALLYTRNKIKLILTGQVDKKYFKKYILPLLKKHKQIQERVKILDKYLELEKYEYYANCLGVVFTPINEAFGFVVSESFFSFKPVITTIDSGAPAQIIKDKLTGLLVHPTPQQIAQAMDTLYENRHTLKTMGQNCYSFALENFNPYKNAKKLLEDL